MFPFLSLFISLYFRAEFKNNGSRVGLLQRWAALPTYRKCLRSPHSGGGQAATKADKVPVFPRIFEMLTPWVLPGTF